MKTAKILLSVICFLATASLASAQIKLSFTPTKGERYRYLYDVNQSVKQTVMGQEIPMDTKMLITYEMDIKEENKQETTIESVYKDICFTASSPIINMAYDSKNPAKNPSPVDQIMAKLFNGLIGKPFTINIAADGTINSVSGINELFGDMVKNLSSDGQMAAQIGSSMQQSFNDETMKNILEQSFKIYPDKEVNIGDSWNIGFSVAISGMTADIKNTYTLKSVERNIALLDVVSIFQFKEIPEVEGEMSGEQKGIMKIDIKTGMPITSDITQNIKGKLNVQGNDIVMDLVSNIKVSTQKSK